YAKALDDMQLLGVRSLVAIDERLGVETDSVDDQRVALVVANRFSVPRRLDVQRMLVGEIDVADLVIGLPDHQDLLRPLHEEERMNAMQNDTRNTNRPTRRLRGKAAFAGTNDLVVLAQILFRPGLQDRAVRVADGDGRLLSGPAKILVGDPRNAAIPGDGTGA